MFDRIIIRTACLKKLKVYIIEHIYRLLNEPY